MTTLTDIQHAGDEVDRLVAELELARAIRDRLIVDRRESHDSTISDLAGAAGITRRSVRVILERGDRD